MARVMYALIHHTAKDTSRYPLKGSNRFTAFINPTVPS